MKLIFRNNSELSLPKTFLTSFMRRFKKYLLSRLPAKIKYEFKNRSELIIVFVSEKEMRRLNYSYRGKDYVTDILSFESDDPKTLGELVLAPSKVREQAKLHKLTFRQELSYLLIHGVLHLLGYEHEKGKKKAEEMFKLQDEAFESLSRDIRHAKK